MMRKKGVKREERNVVTVKWTDILTSSLMKYTFAINKRQHVL